MSAVPYPPLAGQNFMLPVPAGYTAAPGVYDELVAPNGTLREHWARYAQVLEGLGVSEVDRRGASLQRQLRENGVTYNVYADTDSMQRPWQLDPVPLLLRSDEWAQLERGIAQRAYLLNLILEDVYGSRSLLRQRILPPEVVYRNPGFLRPCSGALPRGARWLHVYAADVARDPNGGFTALDDRTQAPSGMGYALENRVVLSRAFPLLYRDTRVQRLAGFFRTLLELTERMAPRTHERAHTVVLAMGVNYRRLGISGAAAGRRRRPDGPRQYRLSEDTQRPVPRRRDRAPYRRLVL